jgi:hypothetical protein
MPAKQQSIFEVVICLLTNQRTRLRSIALDYNMSGFEIVGRPQVFGCLYEDDT